MLKMIAGGWNRDNLNIVIDYQNASSDHAGTEFGGKYIRFKKSQLPERFEFIQSMVLAAYMSGKPIRTYSHNNDCSNATEVAFWY